MYPPGEQERLRWMLGEAPVVSLAVCQLRNFESCPGCGSSQQINGTTQATEGPSGSPSHIPKTDGPSLAVPRHCSSASRG